MSVAAKVVDLFDALKSALAKPAPAEACTELSEQHACPNCPALIPADQERCEACAYEAYEDRRGEECSS